MAGRKNGKNGSKQCMCIIRTSCVPFTETAYNCVASVWTSYALLSLARSVLVFFMLKKQQSVCVNARIRTSEQDAWKQAIVTMQISKYHMKVARWQ